MPDMKKFLGFREQKILPADTTASGDVAQGDVLDGGAVGVNGNLSRELKGRHMQMIAIGGSIGAGLFVGSGEAFTSGGPGSVVIGFIIVGCMLLFTVQALGELAVLYPVNGAFFDYGVRFIDPSWGFAMGWDYALGWLTVLPFEITAASITIRYWQGAQDINIAAWIAIFLVALIVIQFFGVRGYGEVEFFLSIIKITACLGFIILGIIIDCGGVPTDNRGYIGARYWHYPWSGFLNGFKGFCGVFVTAAFSFGGTELVGLAAAEAADPRRTLPMATKQVFWRITFFYVVTLFLIGLIVPADNPQLLKSGSGDSASPFVIAIKLANINALPSVFNAVITISVLSVANSCTFGSTRTIQALAQKGMAPKFLAYVDRKGRPIPCIVLQLLFGLIAFVGEADDESTIFTWLLALSGLSYFFCWGSICLAHIRFRAGWKAQGHSLDELPFKAQFGVIGSWIGLFLVWIAVIATFYVSVFPLGESSSANYFFQEYLAAPIVIALYLFWKCIVRYRSGSWGPLWVKAVDMDVTTGMRHFQYDAELEKEQEKSWRNMPRRLVRSFV